MRKVTMVRLGIAAAISALGAAGAMSSGCSSDDNNNSTSDAGSDGNSSGTTSSSGGSSGGTSSSGTSSGGTSSSSGSSGGVVTPPANLVIVHAAPGLGPFRVCFAIQSSGGTPASVPSYQALPDGPGTPGGPAIPPNPIPVTLADGGTSVVTVAPGTPGIYPGTIGAFPSIGTSLQTIAVTPFIIDAAKVANDYNTDGGEGVGPDGGAEESCPQLIGAHGLGTTDSTPGRLTAGVDYWPLPTIPSGTLKDGNTYLLSITGCLGGYAVSPGVAAAGASALVTAQGTCGPTYPADGGSNLSIGINQVDTTSAVDGGIGVQFINASTAIQGNGFPISKELFHGPATGGLVPGFPTATTTITDGGDLDDGAAAPPVVTTTYGFNPIGAATVAVQANGALPAVVPAAIPFFNADGGTSAAAFGALTTPGSQTDGGEVIAQYPVYTVTAGGETVEGAGDLFALPLSDIFALSGWAASTATASTYFTNGQNYTFVVLGNNDFTVPQLVNADGSPNYLTGGTYDGRGLHIVAFPNTFTAKQVP